MTGLKIGSLFSGIGGLDLAVEEFFDAETAWHCEWEAEPSKVLAARWPGVPNLHDVTKVDWVSVEPVDIMCGGFPCQDVSLAGRRRGMKEGTRSGLWAEFARAIDIVRPAVVVIENVRGLLSADAGGDVEPCSWCMGDGADEYHLRALDAVLADLSDLGFDAEWTGLRAADIGAPHGRFRFFLLAYARGVRLDAWRDAITGEASGGRASAVAGGRADAPLTLLPTPSAGSFNESEPVEAWVARRERVKDEIGNGNGFGMPLGVAVRLLPTPTASEGEKGGPGQMHGNGDSTLSGTVGALLPTPTVGNATGGNARRGGTRSDEALLPGIAREAALGLLPTPRASRGAASAETMYKLGARRDDTGDRQGNVVLLPTTTAGDAKSSRNSTATRHRTPPTGVHAGDTLTDAVVPADGSPMVDWGTYEPAVRLWESLTRPAPAPTLPDGKNGNHRLAAVFPEWMMGYPAGWVTDIIGRNAAIKACGNGVVPQQAFAALTVLWARVGQEAAA